MTQALVILTFAVMSVSSKAGFTLANSFTVADIEAVCV